MKTLLLALTSLLFLPACGRSGAPAGPGYDPFASMPDTSEGLVNVSSDLSALLENGTLPDACAAFASDPSDRRKKLLCGKWMFFYEGFEAPGPPAPLVEFFTKELVPGFTDYGMVADPFSTTGMPLGLALDGAAYSFTCASCHFSRMPDGRYAVGAANHRYDYGGQMLAFGISVQLALGADPAEFDPDAVARVQPILDRFAADPGLQWKLIFALAPLAGGEGGTAPDFSLEAQHQYASWKPGTQDFAIAPLPTDDGVHTVGKILSLFGMPAAEERDATGMQHAMIGWAGIAPDEVSFGESFVAFFGGDTAAWNETTLAPLLEYVLTLRPPEPPAQDAALVAAGAEIFAMAGCAESCHSGPRGSGKRVYSFEEIGTDAAYAAWMDPDLDGTICCGMPQFGDEMMTHGVKSPRLAGLWAMERFLHNGSVDSLEALFCANGPRGTITESPFRDGGHEWGCDLSAPDREALIAYLRSH